MRSLGKRLGAILVGLALCPALALAQRMPRAGGTSAWVSGGLVLPSESGFDTTFGISGGFDYFVTRSFSLGAMAGGWRSGTDFGPDAKEAYLTFVATYNWEGGKLHPFAQGGLGLYRADLPFGSAKTRFGGFAGGGLDVFVNRSMAIEGSLRYHVLSSVNGLNSKFFEGLAGVKFYF